MIKRDARKNRVFVLLFTILFISVVAGSVLSSDVAYIYKNSRGVDNNVIDVFENMGLDVELIDEINLRSVDFSNYKFIFVGDERFRNEDEIPVGDYPSILANYYYGEDWGLTDNDGVSKLASNAPLNVKKDGRVIQVYTKAKYSLGGIGIPYYYLANENKVPRMDMVAATYTGDSYDLGDVISYSDSGPKTCFYGIIESDYWTDDARELFEECVGYVGVTCSKDSDCPNKDIGDEYCIGNKIYKNVEEYECESPGTLESECVDDVVKELVRECSSGCLNGECICLDNDFDGYDNCGAGEEGDDGKEEDCNDNDASVNPGALELCDGKDNDCDGVVDENCPVDLDGDGYDTANPGDFGDDGLQRDCNDNDASINPGADELCDRIDNNCNGLVDEGCSIDNDEDGFDNIDPDEPGDDGKPIDCDDNDAMIYPGAPELCDGKDNDCDGRIDEDYVNLGNSCNVGVGACERNGNYVCSPDASGVICNAVPGNPVIESCNNVDDDCDGVVDENNGNCGTGKICSNGQCVNVVCSKDLDCGEDEFFGNLFCRGDDVYQNYKEWKCNNPGELFSFCEPEISQRLKSNCEDTCSNGACVDVVCSENSDCNDNDLYTVDECINPGEINSYCSNTVVNCLNNNDCGMTGFFGNKYCAQNDVFQNYQESVCENPGTKLSSCDVSVAQLFLNDCGNNYCDSYGNNYCKNNDVYHLRTCYIKGCSQGGCFSNNYNNEELVYDCEFGCSGGVCITSDCVDNDLDGYDTCNPGEPGDDGEPVDCNDNDTMIYPGAPELCDGKDNDCNALTYDGVDETWFNQETSCGIGECSNNGNLGCINGAMFDSCSPSAPSQEVCDGLDNDCDGNVDEGDVCYVPECRDNNDNDFDGLVDSEDPGCWDDLGNPSSYNPELDDESRGDIECSLNSECGTNGFVGDRFCQSGDVYQNYRSHVCNNPGTGLSNCGFNDAAQKVDGCAFGCINGDCIVSNCVDNDLDGYDTCNPGEPGDDKEPVDCNDNDASVNPGADDSNCNGIDEDCDGVADDDYVSTGTRCGLGECSNNGENICVSGIIVNTCSPGTPVDELCDGLDNDCDGEIDEGGVCYVPECQDSVDNDFDGLVDSEDPGCWDDLENPSSYNPELDDESRGGIECSLNSECGVNGFVGNMFCQDNDVYQDYRTYLCNNPGTGLSNCGYEDVAQKVDECAYGCVNGECIDGIHDVGFVDFIDAVNGIKILNSLGDPLGINDELYCDENYKIYIKVKNNGDYLEDITYEGEINGLLFNHIPNTLNPGETSIKYRTINPNLPSGTYSIRIESNILSLDKNLLDNVVQRQIQVLCSHCVDNDGDGYDTCNPGEPGDDGLPVDCDDSDASVNPGADDSNCNNIDEDCDGVVDDDYVSVGTSCGVGECSNVGENICLSGVEINTCSPGTPVEEVCDGLDNDCDGSVDEGCECFEDEDCADDFYSDKYCANEGVYRDYHDFSCVNNQCEEEINSELFQSCISVCEDEVLDFEDDFSTDPNTNGNWIIKRFENANEYNSGVWNKFNKEFILTRPVNDMTIDALADYNLDEVDSKKWKAEFDFKIMASYLCADGIWFKFYSPTNTIWDNSYSIEFDSYFNNMESHKFDDPGIGIGLMSGIPQNLDNHLEFYQTNMCDSKWHHVKVEFDNGNVVVVYDGHEVIDSNILGIDYSKSGIGFVGDTGSKTSTQIIKNFKLYVVEEYECNVGCEGGVCLF